MAGKGRIPDFFIVGAPKCATTALAQYLRQHPNVYIPGHELNYFCTDFTFLARRHQSVDDYLSFFSDAPIGSLVGEKSVSYLSSNTAISSILHVNPRAKFIAMVRNPLDMVSSLHAHLLWMGVEDVPDLERAWFLQEDREQGRNLPKLCTQISDPQLLLYAKVCAIGSQIRRFTELLPESQRYVVVLEDFVARPLDTYREILNFLELPYDGRTDFPSVKKRTAPKSVHIHQLLIRIGLSKSATRFLAPLFDAIGLHPLRVVRRLNSTPVTRAPRPQFRRELARVFAPEVAELEKVLGRRFSHWLDGL